MDDNIADDMFLKQEELDEEDDDNNSLDNSDAGLSAGSIAPAKKQQHISESDQRRYVIPLYYDGA